jgi:8-oxo-dGTP pyrophosphatase MutT (NUDIX family)
MNSPAATLEPDPAAVLVPVFRDRGDRLRVVLIRRTEHGIHGGQIAFPGGRPEDGDGSLIETALRETREEIGLTADRVEILAHLPRVHTRSSRFDIQPFLGHVRPPARWLPSIDEVAEVLTPTIASLAEPGIRRRSQVLPPGWIEPLHVPVLEPEPGVVIWGATYRILVPLLTPLHDGHWAI